MASLGNSRCVLDTGAAGCAAWLQLSRDHLIGGDAAERQRLAAAGCHLAARSLDGRGPTTGPGSGDGVLRLWPGETWLLHPWREAAPAVSGGCSMAVLRQHRALAAAARLWRQGSIPGARPAADARSAQPCGAGGLTLSRCLGDFNLRAGEAALLPLPHIKQVC